jgi:hypothetical protein
VACHNRVSSCSHYLLGVVERVSYASNSYFRKYGQVLGKCEKKTLLFFHWRHGKPRISVYVNDGVKHKESSNLFRGPKSFTSDKPPVAPVLVPPLHGGSSSLFNWIIYSCPLSNFDRHPWAAAVPNYNCFSELLTFS